MVLKGYGHVPLEYLELPDSNTTATVIFLHGMGSSGHELKEKLIEFLGEDAYISHIRFIFPTSPTSYIGLFNKVTTIWYSVQPDKSIAYNDARCSVNYIHSIYRSEVKRGIPPKRIVLAGFSQGGCIALGFGYTRETGIRGVAVMSCAYDQKYQQVSGDELPELYQIHGSTDTVISLEAAKETFDYLTKNGVKGTFSLREGEGHELDKQKIQEIYEFFKRVLPP
ncbi:hypothetical protein O3M35_007250 [Rhynocoris fuscipes]|uniref:palmitoyl-protein hydrolase n=1 Tax=Rhynocoris fuscipes TaxID=488301 RepID=A0AAW1DAA0_9HEMI